MSSLLPPLRRALFFWAGSLSFCHPELRADGRFRKAEGESARGNFFSGILEASEREGGKEKESSGKEK